MYQNSYPPPRAPGVYLRSPDPVFAAEGCLEGGPEGGQRVPPLQAAQHRTPEPQVLDKGVGIFENLKNF